MAVEADRVVVELIAQTQGFDAQIKQSGQNFTATMGDVEKASKGVEAAANDVYTAHNKMGIATNNARIAQMELQHVVRGSVDSFASGASATQIFAQHIASVAEAASFMGGSLGAVGEILAGPWGIAITAGIALVATLISRHKEEGDTVDSLVEKLKKHHDQTLLQNEADQIWGQTIDGLIERLQKLHDEAAKKLELPNLTNQQAYAAAQQEVADINKKIDAAEAKGQDTTKLYQALNIAVGNLRDQTAILGKQVGDVFSDLTKKADDWAQHTQNRIAFITGSHPELLTSTGNIQTAFDEIKKAIDEAAKAGIAIDPFTRQVDALNERLAESPSFVNDYTKDLQQLTAQVEDFVKKSKDAPKAIADFKTAVIGAEGTGANKLGSSAAGFGQFMPDTWRSYFDKLFPDKASLDDAAKLEFRNVKDVAMAVIEAATKDYVKVLQAAGQQITAANLYTVHLLGQRDATRLLTAAPGTPTSSILSPGVLRGNPFLRGTAGSAEAAIAARIGDSSSAVSTGAGAIQRTIDAENKSWADALARLEEVGGKEQKINLLKEDGVNLIGEQMRGVTTLDEMIKRGVLPDLKDWDNLYKQQIETQKELNRFGDQFVEDVLNPDNWKSWGSIAKTVLHDIESELLKLAVINPLENLIGGSQSHAPTLGSTLLSLFGHGGGIPSPGSAAGSSFINDYLDMQGFADGGPVSGGKPIIVGENGPEIFVPSSSGAIVPNRSVNPSNAIAASPYGGVGGGHVLVQIEASPYFDGRVIKVAGPVVAQASVAAANGGATIARRNLGREAQHRLE